MILGDGYGRIGIGLRSGGSPQIGTERQCVTSKKELFSLIL